MLANIILFGVSMIGVFGMLFLKHRELRTGEDHPLSNLAEKGDVVIKEGVVGAVMLARELGTKSSSALSVYFSRGVIFVENSVLTAINWLNKKLAKIFLLIKGQVYPKTKGTVSFFLKHISESKKDDELKKDTDGQS